MPHFETLIWDLQDQVATITLNRPEKKNAMSWVMFNEIKSAFDAAAEEAAVRCVVITGAGGAFCSGADLGDPENLPSSSAERREHMRVIEGIVRSIVYCPKPTIAKVTGVAAGAGCNIALGCDLVVASTDASFAELFVKRGLVVDFGGTWALTRLLPLTKAKELALLGDTISAEDADRLGLLNRLCDPTETDTVVKDLTSRLTALPPQSVAMIKENLNRATERSLEGNLEAETTAQARALDTEDFGEALTAFVQKREPRFTGR